VVESVYEEISTLFGQVKPLYSIWSKLFWVDVAVTTVSVFDHLFTLALPFLGFTLVSFLVLGPVFVALLGVWSSFGVFVIPLFALALAVYALIKFPFIAVEYNPGFGEFLGVYLIYAGVWTLAVSMLYRLTGPPPNIRVSMRRFEGDQPGAPIRNGGRVE
jgi:hypothetical protein